MMSRDVRSLSFDIITCVGIVGYSIREEDSIMEKRYWLHRISYEAAASYSLLNRGFLTTGWGDFSNQEFLSELKNVDRNGFRVLMDNKDVTQRSRWSLWNFSRFKKGDIVLVPQWGGIFSLYEVTDEIQLIEMIDLPVGITRCWDDNPIEKEDGRLYSIQDNEKHVYDLGFFVPVKAIKKDIQRKNVSPHLQTKMKDRNTTVDLNNFDDVKTEIDEICNLPLGEQPKRKSLYAAAVDALQKSSFFQQYLNSDELENLVKIYMKKIGADRVDIPAKNERNKEDYADADVIADFDLLKVRVYIQVKKHVGETNAWAVNQISKYKKQKTKSLDDEYIPLAWALTSAVFSEEAIQKAGESGVRLINGTEFIGMLLDAGITNIDEALS